MDIPSLEGPSYGPKSDGKPKQLVIMLHGLGADGNDLIGLAPHFAEHFPDAVFVSPNAPFPCDMAPFGLQWFSLQIREEQAILDGVKDAAPILDHFIDEQLKHYGLKEENLVLLGFSQGTMLSLYVGLRREKRLGGILGYSGALVGADMLKDEIKTNPEVCLVHGEVDEIVPFDAFKQATTALQKVGVIVHGYSREDLGHGIDPAGVAIGVEFLKRVLLGEEIAEKP